MPKWDQLLDNEGGRHIKRVNKNVFCRKNKFDGNRYGPHQYAEGSNLCLLCGHKRKKHDKEIETDESRD